MSTFKIWVGDQWYLLRAEGPAPYTPVLKMWAGGGWYSHTTPGAPAFPLRVFKPPGLYETPIWLGERTTYERWFILGQGVLRDDGFLVVGPNTRNGYELYRHVATPNRSRPTAAEMNFLYANRDVVGPNYTDAFWTPQIEYGSPGVTTQYLADANRGYLGRNQGQAAQTRISARAAVQRVTPNNQSDGAGDAATNDFYADGTVIRAYERGHIYVDLAHILRHTAVENIRTIRINFSGRYYVGSSATDGVGMSGVDTSQPPPFQLNLDDVTGLDFNVAEIAETYDYRTNPGTDIYRRPFLPALDTDYTVQPTSYTLRYRDTYDLTGTRLASFQAEQYRYRDSGTGFEGDPFAFTYQVASLTTDHLMFKLYVDDVTSVTPPARPGSADPNTWVSPELYCFGILDEVTVDLDTNTS